MLLDALLRRDRTEIRPTWQFPDSTRSLCPECLKVIDAELYEQDGKVLMRKTCDDHGAFNELISSDAEFLKKLRRTHYERPAGIDNPTTPSTASCPRDCGLCEEHLSTATMVNVDLTNRCNLRCPICFANANASGTVCEVSLEQLDKMLNAALAVRPYSGSCLQYAGGEPTVHPDFVEACRMAHDKGFVQIQVATNGLKFAADKGYTHAAADAGLGVAYLQFDGIDDRIYEQTRGRALFETKVRAIENLKDAGIRVVLVPTIARGVNDHEVGAITQFALDHIETITAISWQPVAITGRIDESRRMEMRYTTADLARDLEEQCGWLQMHRDWYPYSIVSPISRLMEAVSGRPHMRISCHPHCGCATYIVVDAKTRQAAPLPAIVDIEPAFADLNRAAERVEKHSWLRTASVIQVLNRFKKYFHEDRAPEGWDFDGFISFVKEFTDFTELHSERIEYSRDLSRRRFHTLFMAAMHFQDQYNFEIDRVRHCVVHYAAPDGRLYPFCTWNSGPCHRYAVEEKFGRPLRGAEEA